MNHANGHATVRTDSFSRARAGRPERILETSDFDHAAVAHDFWFVVEDIPQRSNSSSTAVLVLDKERMRPESGTAGI